MCEFLSFCVDTREGEHYGRLYFGFPTSHSGIERGWGLKPDEYGECEWTEDDSGESLVLRGCHDDMKATILSRYATRKDLFKAIPAIGGKVDNGVDNGTVTYKYSRGNLDCLYESWYDNGKRQYKGNYRNGEFHGLSEGWYDNGKHWYKGNYRNGNAHGLWEGWYPDGKREYKGNYRNGELVQS
jgi:hypothetical protein